MPGPAEWCGAHPDAAAGDAQLGLRLNEDIVPEARLQVALHLGQVEVGPCTHTCLRMMVTTLSGIVIAASDTAHPQGSGIMWPQEMSHDLANLQLHLKHIRLCTCWQPKLLWSGHQQGGASCLRATLPAGTCLALEELLGVMEEVQRKIKDSCGHGLPVHVHVLLQQVPAARPHKQHRSLQQRLPSTSQR